MNESEWTDKSRTAGYYLVMYCSPTLASIKTASLFRFSYSTDVELNEFIREWSGQLLPKGVYLSILKKGQKEALIYVYRARNLFEDLHKPGVQDFLKGCGYQKGSVVEAIGQLALHLAQRDDFPHEIGLFLGYPLEDVLGFIENKGKHSKYSGCWKVYHNEHEAIRIFEKFKRCKDAYVRLYFAGTTVMQLTVAV